MKYQLLKEEFSKELNSNVKMYRHLKSGARILTLENDDNNKVFTVGFKTPPNDDTGVPHIMEHSTLCGSLKFPVKDPFVELLKSSLNTFLNAMTYPDKTIYPVASCNDKDFNNLMEVYMDAVFYPNVYKNEEIFKQEGWHYELLSEDDDIKINGVVYNEMKGAFSSAEEVVMRLSRHMMFPDNTYGVESGGDPDFIPELTYENFKNFHKRYYSASNSYIFLYGNMNMAEKMEWLDKEYLSKFDIIDVDSSIEYQKPFSSCQYLKGEYPISKDEDETDKTYYSYNWVISDYKNVKLQYAFNVLQYALLDAPGAPLKQALLDKGIGKDILSSYDEGILQPLLTIVAKDCKKGLEKEFEKTIYDSLKKIIKDGIDKKAVLASINMMEFKYRENDFGRAPRGLVYITTILDTWLYDDNNPLGKVSFLKIFDELKEGVDNGYFESLINDYLLNNTFAGLLTLSPSKTISEKRENELKNKLKAYKESLSKEEILKLIEDTKHLKEYQASSNTKEELATIPQLSISDINPKAEEFSNIINTYDGINTVRHDVYTNGIAYLRLLFNTDNIKPEYIPYIGLLITILSNVDTDKHSYQDLNKDININTGGINFSFSAYNNNDVISSYLSLEASYLYGKEKFVYDTFLEIIKSSKFDDKKRLKEIINENLSGLYMSIQSRGNSASFTRALSYISKTFYYRDQTSGIAQYQLLKDLIAHFDEKIDDVISILKDLSHQIFRKENLLISYTSQNEDYLKELPSFVSSLYDDEISKYEFNFIKDIKNEGIKLASQVQYVSKVGKFDKKYANGALQVFAQALNYDYLWLKVRVQGGAYGVSSLFLKSGYLVLTSYRDPSLEKTIDVYNNIPEYIDSFNPTNEDITKFVIGAIGSIDAPLSNKDKGDNAMSYYLTGKDYLSIQKNRDEIINVSLNDIKALKSLFVEAFNENVLCVVGSEKAIEDSEKVFNRTFNL